MIRFEIPELETARLRLRLPQMSDFPAFAAFRASERARFVGGPSTRDDAFVQLAAVIGHWHLRGYGRWIAADRATDAPLGLVGLHHPHEWPECELGWTLFAEAEGRGLAEEAARAVRAHAYGTLGWTTLVSLIADDNVRSQSLARRLGCREEGRFHHPRYGALPVWRHPGPDDRAEAAP